MEERRINVASIIGAHLAQTVKGPFVAIIDLDQHNGILVDPSEHILVKTFPFTSSFEVENNPEDLSERAKQELYDHCAALSEEDWEDIDCETGSDDYLVIYTSEGQALTSIHFEEFSHAVYELRDE